MIGTSRMSKEVRALRAEAMVMDHDRKWVDEGKEEARTNQSFDSKWGKHYYKPSKAEPDPVDEEALEKSFLVTPQDAHTRRTSRKKPTVKYAEDTSSGEDQSASDAEEESGGESTPEDEALLERGDRGLFVTPGPEDRGVDYNTLSVSLPAVSVSNSHDPQDVVRNGEVDGDDMGSGLVNSAENVLGPRPSYLSPGWGSQSGMLKRDHDDSSDDDDQSSAAGSDVSGEDGGRRPRKRSFGSGNCQAETGSASRVLTSRGGLGQSPDVSENFGQLRVRSPSEDTVARPPIAQKDSRSGSAFRRGEPASVTSDLDYASVEDFVYRNAEEHGGTEEEVSNLESMGLHLNQQRAAIATRMEKLVREREENELGNRLVVDRLSSIKEAHSDRAGHASIAIATIQNSTSGRTLGSIGGQATSFIASSEISTGLVDTAPRDQTLSATPETFLHNNPFRAPTAPMWSPYNGNQSVLWENEASSSLAASDTESRSHSSDQFTGSAGHSR